MSGNGGESMSDEDMCSRMVTLRARGADGLSLWRRSASPRRPEPIAAAVWWAWWWRATTTQSTDDASAANGIPGAHVHHTSPAAAGAGPGGATPPPPPPPPPLALRLSCTFLRRRLPCHRSELLATSTAEAGAWARSAAVDVHPSPRSAADASPLLPPPLLPRCASSSTVAGGGEEASARDSSTRSATLRCCSAADAPPSRRAIELNHSRARVLALLGG